MLAHVVCAEYDSLVRGLRNSEYLLIVEIGYFNIKINGCVLTDRCFATL